MKPVLWKQVTGECWGAHPGLVSLLHNQGVQRQP